MSEEARKKASERMKKMHEEKKAQEPTPQPTKEQETSPPEEIQSDQNIDDLKRQIEEMKQNMAFMQSMFATQPQQLNRNGRLLGEFEKYTVNPANYEDPTKRLAKEPRLAPLAFEFNYELDYRMDVTSYETKTGENVKEPRFHVTLYRVVLDDQGNRVQINKDGKLQDKFYIARKLIFHEDPSAAMAIARENGIEVNNENERDFLNEMRYLRVRDWLFDIFWPKPSQEIQNMGEEVIGGQVVQVFTRNSEESGSIPFDQMNTKLRA